MNDRDALQLFERRLAETIAWCSRPGRSADPQAALRTPALRPLDATDDGHRCRALPTAANVNVLVEARATWVQREGLTLPAPRELAGGRLLWADPNETINTGTVEPETEGFIDYDDMPGWDSWICFVKEGDYSGYLVCWVPPEFIATVEAGSLVSCTEPFRWASVVEGKPFLQQLRAVGLLG